MTSGKVKYHSIKVKSNILFVLVLVFTLLSSCIKIDTPPSLEITVLDQYNNPVDGALIAIFDSFEEWSMLKNPVQVWKESDTEGKVTFINLEPLRYYIFVEKDSLNNLKNEIATDKPLEVNVIAGIRIHID